MLPSRFPLIAMRFRYALTPSGALELASPGFLASLGIPAGCFLESIGSQRVSCTPSDFVSWQEYVEELLHTTRPLTLVIRSRSFIYN